ncbi:hypothetical protein [Natrinema gelatinilyticum]|uniref:hypothetical protein n=1 Tax=Natrinema gelatinilyticum TaxID=2961571 RepID=UPI0020C1F503|nr:hypothetical protein [Natrinema gelatinilyticum]
MPLEAINEYVASGDFEVVTPEQMADECVYCTTVHGVSDRRAALSSRHCPRSPERSVATLFSTPFAATERCDAHPR